MGDGGNPRKKPAAKCLPAGPKAGIIAVLTLSGWRALTPAHIMATTFPGEVALDRDFTFPTAAGFALYLVLRGIIGALFELTLASRNAGLQIVPVGALADSGRDCISFATPWRNINPLITLYTHRGPAMASHSRAG
ncbi:MAG: hypothetical protein ABSG65_00310 [Bryobacteraceae bacterium]|jgi:hypothetical protein